MQPDPFREPTCEHTFRTVKLLASWADALHTLRGKDFSCEWYFVNSGSALDGAVRFNHDMVTCLLAVNNVVARF